MIQQSFSVALFPPPGDILKDFETIPPPPEIVPFSIVAF